MEDRSLRKLLSNDTVFNIINKKFITLHEDDIKRNNVHLQKCISALIEKMKNMDSLFKKSYETILFSGSFYKGTRVGAPEEFDLDITIRFPINYDNVQFHSNKPGYTKIYFPTTTSPASLTNEETKRLNSFFNGNYIQQDSFRRWIEGLIDRVILTLPHNGSTSILTSDDYVEYGIKTRKSGPAFTIMLYTPDNTSMDIDFVPALSFAKPFPNGCQPRQSYFFRNNKWLAIPKPLPSADCDKHSNLYWRYSFYYHEKEILLKYGYIKPVIRQIKKLRDVQNWKTIASYYIETLFLNEIETLQDYNRIPFTLLLFVMLQKLHSACSSHRIEYYWNRKYNLIENVKPIVMDNIAARLNTIIIDIKKNLINDHLVIAKYILTAGELRTLKYRFDAYEEETESEFKNSVAEQISAAQREASNSMCTIL